MILLIGLQGFVMEIEKQIIIKFNLEKFDFLFKIKFGYISNFEILQIENLNYFSTNNYFKK